MATKILTKQYKRVDLVVAVDDRLCLREIVLDQRIDRPSHGEGGELPHREQLVLEPVELVVEMTSGHQPNLPVT